MLEGHQSEWRGEFARGPARGRGDRRKHGPRDWARGRSKIGDGARPRVADGSIASSMDLQAVIRAYRRYANIYDLIFGPAFQMGRLRSVARINALDCRTVLEVGVGTGLSLPRYRRDKKVIGIDVSREMLKIARQRVERGRLGHVDTLAEMDAQYLGFPTGHFDAVVAMHVMSVVPDPAACLAEMQRVCRPGGTILICNHFAGRNDRWISRRIEPLAKWLGWHPDFALSCLLNDSSLEVASSKAVPPFGMFKLIELVNP